MEIGIILRAGLNAVVGIIILGLYIYTNKRVSRVIKQEVDEAKIRSLLMKEKDYVLDFCSNLIQQIKGDMAIRGVNVNYVEVSYVVEKIEIEWLGWLLVNNINNSEEYLSIKSQQIEFIAIKGAGKVNSDLINNSWLKEYFHNMSYSKTKELVEGLISIKKIG